MSIKHEVKKYLHDMLTAARDIQTFTRDLTDTDFSQNGLVQSAVERKFEIIGEALSKAGRLDAGTLEQITDFRRIISFRNIIIHGYDAIDHHIVWDAVQHRVPLLIEEVAGLLEK